MGVKLSETEGRRLINRRLHPERFVRSLKLLFLLQAMLLFSLLIGPLQQHDQSFLFCGLGISMLFVLAAILKLKFTKGK
jgi:hypothetical protein